MSINQALAQQLALIAKMQDLLGADRFRAISNERAARTIEGLSFDVASLVDKRDELLKLDGIGPKIADKIVEFVTTGRIAELEELKAQVPPGVVDLLGIPGLGPKTAAVLWKQGGVTDLAGLKRIIDSGDILKLPRMGAKSVERLKEAIALAEAGSKRLALGLAMPVAVRIVALLRKVRGVRQVAYAGSLRRGRETVGDIDILVAADDPRAVSETFRAMPEVRQVLAAGEFKSSAIVAVHPDLGRWALEGKEGDEVPDDASGKGSGGGAAGGPTIQVDLRVVPAESWGAAMLYFTGSKDHNIELRERALSMGLTLNEYGLFPEDGQTDEPPQKRGIKPVASRTEEEVYARLGMVWTPPEMRENQGEVQWAIEEFEKQSKPRARRSSSARSSSKTKADEPHAPHDPAGLIEVSDIVAELHAHTTASDGSMTIAQLAAAARQRGFHTIAVTDHSRSSAIANGLSIERLEAHVEAIHRARDAAEGITILAGSEVDILADGKLDYPDTVLKGLDIVVASPHTALSQDPAAATDRLLRAIANPYVHILGHPTGRLINRRAGLSPDTARIIAAAKAHNVALEINAHWLRLDLRDTHVRAAVEAGCLIAIDCDVHAPEDFDNLIFGVLTARRGWLRPEQCINTWPADKLHAWLRSKR